MLLVQQTQAVIGVGGMFRIAVILVDCAVRLDGAIEAARRLAEIEPDDPLSHTNLSRLYQQKGLIEEAEKASAVAMQLQMRSSN